jgi:hypothetical protein
MRNSLALFVLAASIAACSSANTVTPVDDRALFNLHSSIDLTAEGGFAALSVHHAARNDDRAFVFTQRHICSATCGAPLDSAAGTLSPAATDSLFDVVLAQTPLLTKDDYGATQGGADMMTYTLRLTLGGATRTIRADDGTMPEPMRAIVQSLHATISAARK